MHLSDKSFNTQAGVYIITCLLNNKSYVGESMNIKRRMKRHCNGKRQVINKAIIKYGVENFQVYVEYFPQFDKDSLLFLEEQLICKVDSIFPRGYNIATKGYGRYGAVLSTETKNKISESLTGRSLTTDHKLKVSESLKGNKRSLGNMPSTETKEKLRESANNYYKDMTPDKKLKMDESRKKAWVTRRLNQQSLREDPTDSST